MLEAILHTDADCATDTDLVACPLRKLEIDVLI